MKYLIIILAVLFVAPLAMAQENELTQEVGGQYYFVWTANEEPDLAGYRLYRSATSGQYTYGEGSAFATFGLVSESPPFTVEEASGTYYFVLTAFDAAGLESGPSIEQTLNIEDVPPNPPQGLSIWQRIIAWLKNIFGRGLRIG